MHRTSAWLLVLALLAAMAPGRPAAAEDEPPNEPQSAEGDTAARDVIREEPDVPGRDALAYNAEILDEVLERSTQETLRQQKFAAAAGVTGGATLLGLGTWRLVQNNPQNQYSRGLGLMFMAFGMTNLTTGVFAVSHVTHERRRLDRWKRARKDGITDVELAHFEGELQAARETRQGGRLLARWIGLTHALAGVLVLAFTPVPDNTSASDRAAGYTIGSMFTATGTVAFATSFRPTPSEKAWQEYSKRKIAIPGHELSWSIAPAISKQAVGLSVSGAF